MAKPLQLTPDMFEFFDLCPTVMVLFEIESFRIVAANAAAAEKYGYSAKELTQMTIMELRPSEDIPRVARLASRILDGADAAGRSRHLTRSGKIFIADVQTQVVQVNGRPCKLAAMHDVTEQSLQEDLANKRLAEAAARERSAQTTERHFAELFNVMPGVCAVLLPQTFEVVAITEDYLDLLGMSRADVIGHPIPELMSAQTADLAPDALEALRTSLRRVADTQRDDVIKTADLPFEMAFSTESTAPKEGWTAVNMPLEGPDGSLHFVLHSISQCFDTHDGRAAKDDAQDQSRRLEISQHSHELAALSRQLAESEGLLRTSEQLLNVHVWRFDVNSQQLYWSDALFKLFGLPVDSMAPTFEEYVAMVHPDDRNALIDDCHSFFEDAPEHFTFSHRVIRPDESIIHVKGAVRRISENGRTILSGVVQDVTQEAEAKAKARRRDHLLRVAGEVGRVGGWRFDLPTRTVEWSPETARIHEMPETREVGVQQATAFYAAEHQDVITERFTACAKFGIPFDEMLQIETARNNRVWVRAVGAPERGPDGRIVGVQGAFQDFSQVVKLHQQTHDLRARLGSTLEHMSDAFVLIDPFWRFTYLNKKAEMLLHRENDELFGKNIWSEFPEALGSRFETEYHRVVETGVSAEFEEFYAPLNMWFRLTAHPSKEGLAIYFRDVTEEHVRNEHVRLLNSAVENMSDILLITEASPLDGPDSLRIRYVNDAFERISGYSASEVIGRCPRFLQGPRTERRELGRIRSALERHEKVRTELINYTRDGREYWVEIDIFPLVDGVGNLTHFVALQRDITERRDTEARIRRNEERLRLLTQATELVIWDWDILTGRIWWNENLITIFGFDPISDSFGMDVWRAHVHPQDRVRVLEDVWKAIRSSAETWSAEYRLKSASGHNFHVVDRGFIIRDETGRATRMLGSITDVTKQQEIEAMLRQSQKLEAIGQLTGGVAHDFNNLLTVIMGRAECLTDDLADWDEVRCASDTILQAAERGAELTNRLLAFARAQPLEPVVVNLNETIRSLTPLICRSLGEHIEMDLVLADDLWLSEIDPFQFETGLLNLAINARDAMPSGGKLTVETSNISIDEEIAALMSVTEGGFVSVAVSDTGIGMSADLTDRALEPFYTTKSEGSGLGLSMVFGFTKQSGGHLKIYSEVGEGTTIKLFFPLSGAEHPDVPDEVVTPGNTNGNGEHVLVVEDDPFVRQHVVSMMRELGYRISEAETAAVALDLLAGADDIVVLFTDIVMPGGMSGPELADEARRLRPDLNVLYTSGYTENAIVHKGRLDAGVQLLSKPYRQQDLGLKLRAILDRDDPGDIAS